VNALIFHLILFVMRLMTWFSRAHHVRGSSVDLSMMRRITEKIIPTPIVLSAVIEGTFTMRVFVG